MGSATGHPFAKFMRFELMLPLFPYAPAPLQQKSPVSPTLLRTGVLQLVCDLRPDMQFYLAEDIIRIHI